MDGDGKTSEETIAQGRNGSVRA